MYNTFICYRRDGGDNLAHHLYDRLMQKNINVFFDIESLRSGKFNSKLLSIIDECENVLVVLPPNALDRCMNDENDWVRIEIRHALETKKNIIPIMLKGFEFPSTLPEEIDEIRYYNGITCSTEYFDAVIEKIVALLNFNGKKRSVLRERNKLLKNIAIATTSVAVLGCLLYFIILNNVRTHTEIQDSDIKTTNTMSSDTASSDEGEAPSNKDETVLVTTAPEPTEESTDDTSVFSNLKSYANEPFRLFDSPTITSKLRDLLGANYEYFLSCFDSINAEDSYYDADTGSIHFSGGVVGLYTYMEACLQIDSNGDISAAFIDGGLESNPDANSGSIYYYGNNLSNRDAIISNYIFDWIWYQFGTTYPRLIYGNSSEIPQSPIGKYEKINIGTTPEGSLNITELGNDTFSFFLTSFFGANTGEAEGEISISNGYTLYPDDATSDQPPILFMFSGDYVTVLCKQPEYYGGMGVDISGVYELTP